MLETLAADVRHALRQLRRAPGFSAVVILCLALGIGLNVATFGVVDALLFRAPAGVRDPDGVRRLRPEHPPTPGQQVFFNESLSRLDAQALGARAEFAALGLYATRQGYVGDGAAARRERVTIVGADYFRALGVGAALGRLFGADEQRAAPAPVAVVSDAYWRRALGADPRVVGRTLRLNGRPVTIIGVTPPRFTGVELEPAALFVPLNLATIAGVQTLVANDPTWQWLDAVVRLAPGVSAERATAVATSVLRGVAAAAPGGLRGPPGQGARFARLAPVQQHFGGAFRDESPIQLWMLGATAAVLLVVCANVANMLLVRAERRRREIAMRLALGAATARIARQLFTEGVVLAVLGGALGLALAAAGARAWLLVPGVPALDRLVEGRSALFALAATILTTLAFALAPAWRASRGNPGELVRSGSRSTVRGSRLQGALLVVQFAASLTLLGAGALFLRSMQAVRGVDVGFALPGLVVASVDWEDFGIPESEAGALLARAAERARGLRGVTGVSVVGIAPFEGASMATLDIPGRPDAAAGSGVPGMFFTAAVDTAYFRTTGIAIVRGRAFEARDAAPNGGGIIVNEAFARRVWPDADPIGRCVASTVEKAGCTVVVGVARDAHFLSVVDPVPPLYYSAMARQLRGPSTLVVRTRGRVDATVAQLRTTLMALDRRIVGASVRPLEESALGEQLGRHRARATTFALFGGLALLLSAVGLYGVVAYTVAQRTGEFGVRLALGARGADVVALVVRQGLRTSLLGGALGVGGAAVIGRLLRAKLYGVQPLDPPSLIVPAVVLLVAALVAAWLPARRAAAVDPVDALRAD